MLTFLPWDTAHFGERIARANPRQLNADACARLLAACQEQAIDCLYFLADCDDQPTIAVLKANDFDFVDIRIILALPLDEASSPTGRTDVSFRLGREDDLPGLLPIARSSYHQSRFYIDRRFGANKATEMFEIWLSKSFLSDYAGAVVVAEHDGNPQGFLTVNYDRPPGEGNIGLLGVAESARGKGLAPGMVAMAERLCQQQGMTAINLVTQGCNIVAQRMYQRRGYRTRSLELWFHKWFAADPANEPRAGAWDER